MIKVTNNNVCYIKIKNEDNETEYVNINNIVSIIKYNNKGKLNCVNGSILTQETVEQIMELISECFSKIK